MAQINKPTDYFNTVLWSGNGSTQSITGVGFAPDWTWIKGRSAGYDHQIYDTVRGANEVLNQTTGAEGTQTGGLTSFDSDGFTLGSNGRNNASSATYVAWNWLAGGTAPAITYTVKVVSDSGNKYRFDDFGTSAVTLDLQEGGTYTFDQSDSSNSGHPLRFSTTSDGTHGGGSEYTTNVTTTGTPGSAGAKTVITVASSAPTLYYYCSVHSGMGGQANTNSTFGSSNFGGSIQANVSANTTSGFSLVSWTGTGANATIGHGLGVAPKMVITKNRSVTDNWTVGNTNIGWTKYLYLNSTAASATDSLHWQDTAPTSSVFSVGTRNRVNGSGHNMIAYCFAEKKGFSKFGTYTGNGNTDGTFVYTGFAPAWVVIKRTNSTGDWILRDNKMKTFNVRDNYLLPSSSGAEVTSAPNNKIDLLSNGFKQRSPSTGTVENASGGSYIYMAFAENPLVGTNNIPATAR